jgi:hypothetical protein
MRVLRLNKDSVMAMLEAFVHDPLINWRLLNAAEAATEAAIARDADGGAAGGAAAPGAAPGGAAAAGGAAAGGAAGAQQQQGGGGGGAPAQHTAADFAGEGAPGGAPGGGADGTANGGGGGEGGFNHSPPQRGARERELREARDQLAGDASEVGGREGALTAWAALAGRGPVGVGAGWQRCQARRIALPSERTRFLTPPPPHATPHPRPTPHPTPAPHTPRCSTSAPWR